MKKLSLAGILSIPLSLCLITQAVSASEVQVVVDGYDVSFPDQIPYIDEQSNRTMVTARFVVERLGANVHWNENSKEVTITYKDKTIILTIGQKQAQVNGLMITLDTPAVIKNNRTMIPLRFITEAFHAEVEWNDERDQVIVTMPLQQKGTWIWDAQIIKTDQKEIFTFARENSLTTIYLHIDRDLKQQDYQDFIRNANSQNIRVEALAGKPDWAFKDQRARIKEFILWVKTYNATVAAKERFHGLHFDIEPYILEQWNAENKLVLEHWMDNLRFIEREIQGSGLKTTLDVPFWIYRTKVPDTEYTFSSWLLEKFDSLVIMNYRNFSLGSNGIVAIANPIMREASHLNKQVILAVETAPNTEGDHVSFHTMGTDRMEKELSIANQELVRFSSYAGMAIHDYKNWTSLKGGVKK